MRGSLLSINIAEPAILRVQGLEIPTGIFKKPAAARTRLGRLGLSGDVQMDPEAHGGPEQAVYLYPFEHYGFWEIELARNDLSPGFFGENFTTSGLTEENVSVGDVFRVGSSVVQVTSPRSPCFKLAARVGSPAFVQRFLASGRLGFYHRVLEEGEVASGDAIERIAEEPERITVSRMIRLLYMGGDPRDLEHALRIASLDAGARTTLEARLARANGRIA